MRFHFTIAAYFIFATLFAQQPDTDPGVIADDLARFADTDANYEDLYENYLQLLSNPIDLNNATREDLRSLQLLSELQITNLHQYIKENGRLISLYELQAIPAFDLQTITRIQSLVKVDDPQSLIGKPLLARAKAEGSTYIVARYERTFEQASSHSSGDFASQKYLGSPDKLYLRFRSSRNKDYSIGFTAEKDAGEQLQWNPKRKYYGVDYLSFHAQVMNKKRIKNLIVGDYQYQFAQGLVLGNAFGLGKGGETINTIRKSNIGFTPYTSVNESSYMRGAACTYQLYKNLHLSTFISSVLRDGNIYGDSSLYFSAIQTTGLHRNYQELSNRKQINEVSYGGVINFRNTNLDAGVIFQSIYFDIPLQRSEALYRQFNFQGRQNMNGSLFINYTYYNVAFFSEVAKSFGNGIGVVGGLLASLDQKLDMSILFRRYEKDYVSFYSNALAENTTPQNETGVYWGWKYKFNRRYSIAAYADLFTFPWLKFRVYKPSQGNEFLARFNYQPSKKTLLFLQFRQETKERNLPTGKIYNTDKAIKHNFTFSCDYTASDNVRLKTRGQMSSILFNHTHSSGLALMQDIVIKVKRFQTTGRFCLFDTDDFENRQYAYENDVWLAYSLPAYNGQGNKNVLMLQYQLFKKVTCWLRYARTRYTDRSEVSNGTEIIGGNSRNDVKLQVRVIL